MKSNKLTYFLLFVLFQFTHQKLVAQKNYFQHLTFTKADSLRGSLSPERTCFDVHYYALSLDINPFKKFLNGSNEIHFICKKDFKQLQIDLFENMEIEKILFENSELSFQRIGDAVFVNFPFQKAGTQNSFVVYYNGYPKVAENPPWEGGFIWNNDQDGNPWVGVACQGIGASLWWPNKDHLSDEPDSMSVSITVPSQLKAISNGQLRNTIVLENEKTRYDWFVSYPINNYNVTVNIGNYTSLKEEYQSLDGSELQLTYHVLPQNEEKAKGHFQQMHKILLCYEKILGKYPFWKDGFSLIEAPFLGMEHQSAIAYGNDYQDGYLGQGLPEGMHWDYVLVHETGHEYFGNSLSCNDMAEIWLHESFTTYMEALYVECAYDYESAVEYMQQFRDAPAIKNSSPIVGPLHVNWDNWYDSDNYYKGAWILHSLRHVIYDDVIWFDLLKSFYEQHQYGHANTSDFLTLVNSCAGKDFAAFFDQYLYSPDLPVLHYKTKEIGEDLEVTFKWKSSVEAFNMPVLIGKRGSFNWVQPFSYKWSTIMIQNLRAEDFEIAEELFLIETKEIK